MRNTKKPIILVELVKLLPWSNKSKVIFGLNQSVIPLWPEVELGLDITKYAIKNPAKDGAAINFSVDKFLISIKSTKVIIRIKTPLGPLDKVVLNVVKNKIII